MTNNTAIISTRTLKIAKHSNTSVAIAFAKAMEKIMATQKAEKAEKKAAIKAVFATKLPKEKKAEVVKAVKASKAMIDYDKELRAKRNAALKQQFLKGFNDKRNDEIRITIDRKAVAEMLEGISGIGKKTVAKLMLGMALNTLVEAILDNNASKLADVIGNRVIPGTSTKMADAIVKATHKKMANMLAEAIKSGNNASSWENLNLKRFQVNDYEIIDLMPAELRKLFRERAETKCVEDEIVALRKIYIWMRDHKDWTLSDANAEKAPMVANMAQSMLSDKLGVVYGAKTNKIGLLDNSYVVCGAINYKNADGDYADHTIMDQLNKGVTIVQQAFVEKAQLEGLWINGVNYVEELASSGQRKKMHTYIFPREVVEQNWKLFNIGGLTIATINAHGGWSMSKYGQVRALVTSSSVPLSAIIGKNISVDEMLIVSDISVIIDVEKAVEVDGEYKTKAIKQVKVKMTDGGAVCFDKALKNKMLQCRLYAGGKGTIAWFDLIAYCKERGYKLIVKDMWNVDHDVIKEGIKMIVPESVIKIAKYFGEINNPDSMNEYRKFVKDAGMDEIRVCSVEEYGRKRKCLTRQSMQTLVGLNNEALAEINADTIVKFQAMKTIAGAVEMLSENKDLGAMVKAYPAFVASNLAQAMMREGYESAFMDAAFGRIDVDANFRMSIYDICAAVDVWFGGKDPQDPTIGVLLAGEVTSKKDRNDGVTELALFRYPVNGFKGEVVKVSNSDEARKWLTADALFFSFHDVIVAAMDGDHDGDHFLCVRNSYVIEAVRKYRKVVDRVFYSFDNDARKSQENKPIPDAANEFAKLEAETRIFAHEHNDIGENSNYVRSEFALFTPDMDAEEFVTRCCRIAIESAAGQASVDSTKTNIAALRLPAKFVKEVKFAPFTQRFKKAVDGHPMTDEEYWSKKTAPAGKSVGDRNAMMFVDTCGMEYVCIDNDSVEYDPSMFTMTDDNVLSAKSCSKVAMDDKLYRTIKGFCRYMSKEAGWAPKDVDKKNDKSFEAKIWTMVDSDLGDQERKLFDAGDMDGVAFIKNIRANASMSDKLKYARVSMLDLFDLLSSAEGAFFRSYREDNDVEEDIDGLVHMEDIRLKALKQILIDNVKVAGSYDCSGWTESDKCHFIADKLWRHVAMGKRSEDTEENKLHSRKGNNFSQLMVIKLFGQELAEFAMARADDEEE